MEDMEKALLYMLFTGMVTTGLLAINAALLGNTAFSAELSLGSTVLGLGAVTYGGILQIKYMLAEFKKYKASKKQVRAN